MSGLLSAEHILDGSWATSQRPLTNETVASRFDRWYKTLQELSSQGTVSPEEQGCLDHFLKVDVLNARAMDNGYLIGLQLQIVGELLFEKT